MADPGAPRVRETCHPVIVKSSDSAGNCNDLRHNVIAAVCDENSNTGDFSTTVAIRPYSGLVLEAQPPVDVTLWR